jgi:hypothetical protein
MYRYLTSSEQCQGADGFLTTPRMAQFTRTELVDMVKCYGASQDNAVAAVTLYAERFPDRRQPLPRTLRKVIKRFEDTGSVHPRPRSGRPRSVRGDDDMATTILAAVAVNPHTSSRAIANEVGCSKSSVHNVLRSYKFHPYHVHCHQALNENDFYMRAEYCNWLLTQLDDDPQFTSKVMWSDEAQFDRNGVVNCHNLHYWAVENPHWLRQSSYQQNWRCNVWCGLHGNKILGPVFFDGTLTGQRYCDMILNDTVEEFMDEQPLSTASKMWFQHDGAPPHFACVARERLNELFEDRWIGRGGPVPWPARSPDLNPMDFFLWGHVKSVVYNTPPASMAELQQRISVACGTIPNAMLERVHKSTKERIQLCLAADGQHMEHYLH